MSAFAGNKAAPRALAAGFALSLAFSSSAFALDSKSFLDNVQSGMQPYGLSLNYQSSAAQQDSVTLKNVRLMQQSGEAGDKGAASASVPIYLGDVTFSGIKAAADGSYDVTAISAGNGSMAQADAVKKAGNAAPLRIIVQNMAIAGAHIDPIGKSSTIAEHLPYQAVSVGNISYQTDGKTALSIDGAGSRYVKKDGGIVENTSQISAFTYDPASLPGQGGQDAGKMLSSLGYDKISGRFAASGIWNPQSGALDIKQYKLTADNVGAISFSGKLGGITENFAGSYQKLLLQQAEEKNPTEKQRQKMNQQILALASQLEFDAFTLSYKDNSFAGRVLDSMSKSAAVPRRELVALLKAGVLQNTQKFQNTDFASYAAGQIGAFLDNPQSFSITAAPQRPVSFSALLLAFSLAPEQLINLLGVNVTANK